MFAKARILLIPLFFALAGCAATGPISSPEYPALVEAAVPPEAGKVVMSAPGNWFPNTVGFTDVRSTGGYGATTPISVVIVVTSTAVVLEQWDDRVNRFNVIKLLKLADITEASIDTFAAGTRLVLKLSDYSYNSFEFTRGQFVDGTKAREVATYLSSHVGKQTIAPQ